MLHLAGRLLARIAWKPPQYLKVINRQSAYYRNGALKPEPQSNPFGIVVAICVMLPGLIIGGAISKCVAEFLEQYDIFVPQELNDDDDD